MKQEENNSKYLLIKCPYCGWEYVPAELFNPTDLEGKPEDLLKDNLGKVLYVDYHKNYSPCQVTRYICDGCGKPFVVEPTVTYKVKKEAKELDFSTTTSSLLD